MSPYNVLVIGATGNQGTGVIQHLLSASSSSPDDNSNNNKRTYRPIALTRDPSSPRAQSLLSKFPSLTFLKGDINDHDNNPQNTLSAAMKTSQIRAVFFIIMPSPPSGGGADAEIQSARNVVRAAKESGTVEHVIYSGAAWTGMTSTDGEEGGKSDKVMGEYWRGKRGVEGVVREETEGKMKWTIIRPATFLQNWLPPVSGILYPEFSFNATTGTTGERATRKLRVGYREDLKVDLVDCGDVGKVVVKALGEEGVERNYSGREIDLAGEALTMGEFARRVEKGLGLSGEQDKIEVEHVDPDVLAAERPGIGERLMAAPKMFNRLGNYFDADECREEFGLTTVEEFFRRNREKVFASSTSSAPS